MSNTPLELNKKGESIVFTESNSYYASDKAFYASSDAKTIQNAINTATADGINKVIIPRHNRRSDSSVWIIDETILLPSGITVVLDDCYIKMADNVFCNCFKNSNANTPAGLNAEGEQQNISILGFGAAEIDGGNHNGLTEKTSLKDGFPHISSNLTVYLHNVKNFKIGGFRISNQRWWAMAFMFCRYGRIFDMSFHAHNTAPNQDGIDLRVGCNNITIENITGFTGDDTVALTALLSPVFEAKQFVAGKESDIHSVIIRNIVSNAGTNAVIRLLNHDGNKLYNIIIDNVIDSSPIGSEKRLGALLRIGENHYFQNRPVKAGETFNIIANNIISRAKYAVCISACLSDSTISNVMTFDEKSLLLGTRGGAVIENVKINNENIDNLN